MASLVQAMGGADTFSARLDTFFSAGFHGIPILFYFRTWAMNDATLAQYYNTSSGAMGAYAVWTHLDTYLLSRPYFPKITIRNEATGAVATIIASGLSDQNKYIQSATLDGQSYTKNWLSHKFFSKGGTLTLDLPMSLSTGGFGCNTCISPTNLRGPTTSNITDFNSTVGGGSGYRRRQWSIMHGLTTLPSLITLSLLLVSLIL
ncbi:glycosyl hydrolase family 92-domain-containing protein [Mycena olivaceomarginata]|nr:glycosyl hydrolase family 92-domain-containing protein [Mycena olivaceomarginata]